MAFMLVIVAIFALSIVLGSAIGSVLARLVLNAMTRGLVASRRTTSMPPTS